MQFAVMSGEISRSYIIGGPRSYVWILKIAGITSLFIYIPNYSHIYIHFSLLCKCVKLFGSEGLNPSKVSPSDYGKYFEGMGGSYG